jgi:hypothetical protein
MASYVNLSLLDRCIRIALGVLMLAAAGTGWAHGVWGVALLLFGWVPLVTGALGWSPVYALLGIRTQVYGRPRS